MPAYCVVTHRGVRRAGPFTTDAEAMDALAELHRIEGTGCMDLDVEVVQDPEGDG